MVVVFALGCAACVGEAPGDPNPVPAVGSGGGSGGSGQSGQTSVTATRYLEDIATLQCAEAFSCRSTYPGDAASFEAVWQTSVETCVSNLLVAWNANSIETEIAKGRIDFDGTAAVDCLNGVAFGSCDQHWTNGIQWVESCYHVMVGNVAAGGTCDSVYACESSTCDTAEHRCI